MPVLSPVGKFGPSEDLRMLASYLQNLGMVNDFMVVGPKRTAVSAEGSYRPATKDITLYPSRQAPETTDAAGLHELGHALQYGGQSREAQTKLLMADADAAYKQDSLWWLHTLNPFAWSPNYVQPDLRHRNVFGDREAPVRPLAPPDDPGHRIREIQRSVSAGIPKNYLLSGYQQGDLVDKDEAQMHYLTSPDLFPTPSHELGVMLRDYGIPWNYVDSARRMLDNTRR